jgi:hypothetical protein
MKERIVRAVAGSIVLISVTLAFTQHIYWLGLAAFVGVNLLQSSFTKFCPLEIILYRFGVRDGEKKSTAC